MFGKDPRKILLAAMHGQTMNTIEEDEQEQE